MHDFVGDRQTTTPFTLLPNETREYFLACEWKVYEYRLREKVEQQATD